jgi:hypothetical protein
MKYQTAAAMMARTMMIHSQFIPESAVVFVVVPAPGAAGVPGVV